MNFNIISYTVDYILMFSGQDLNFRFRRIVVLTGAGISRAAGFPTFYDQDSIDIKCIENVYDTVRERMRENPEPTAAHQLLFLLYKKGYIKRIYTQNIDDLHEKSGIPSSAIVH